MIGLKGATIKDYLQVRLHSAVPAVVAFFAATAMAATVAKNATVRSASGLLSVVRQDLTTGPGGHREAAPDSSIPKAR